MTRPIRETPILYGKAKMKLKHIKNNEDIKPFDCGDADLNGFLPITNIRN